MWFKRKKQQKRPFAPLSLEQMSALDVDALKKYQRAHAEYSRKRIKEIQEQSAAQIQAIQEQEASHEREVQEQRRRNDEETQRTLREIFERGVQQRAEEQEKTAEMMQRALGDPLSLATLQQAFAPEPPAVPHLGNEQIIEGEILSSEEIQTPKKEDTHD